MSSEFFNYAQAGDTRKIIEYLRKYSVEYNPDFDKLLGGFICHIYNEAINEIKTEDMNKVLEDYLVLFADNNCEKVIGEITNKFSDTPVLNELLSCSMKYANASQKIINSFAETIKSGSLDNSVKLLTKYPGLLEASKKDMEDIMKENEKNNELSLVKDHYQEKSIKTEALHNADEKSQLDFVEDHYQKPGTNTEKTEALNNTGEKSQLEFVEDHYKKPSTNTADQTASHVSGELKR